MLQNSQSQRNNRSFRAAVTFSTGLARPHLAAISRELIYRTIVERHIGKHTGLRYPAKACPAGRAAVVSGREAAVAKGPGEQNSASGAQACRSPIRERGHGCFVGKI